MVLFIRKPVHQWQASFTVALLMVFILGLLTVQRANGADTDGAETDGADTAAADTYAAETSGTKRKTDAATGLIVAEHWQLVQAHCGACHSYRLVTANRGDRDYWLSTLRWMQRTQNLWPIPFEQEAKLLDYLAANYLSHNETEWGRRPPLPPALLPNSG